MGGSLYDGFESEDAVAPKFKEKKEGMLDEGKTCGGLEVEGIFLGAGVWGVVGGDYVNSSLVDCVSDGLLVGVGLDGGVALHERSVGGVG